MPLELDFKVWTAYAQAHVSGQGSLEEFLDILRRVAMMTSHSHPLLLLDLRQLDGLVRTTEQMTAGMEAAHQLSHASRVAVVEPSARVTFNGEKVARRLGLNLRVFAAEEEQRALSWLIASNDAFGTASPVSPERH